MTKVNVGLRIPAIQPANPEELRAFVQHAEALGFDAIFVGDHVFYHMDVPQPLQLLTWIAGQTNRVRLGTSVMLTSYLNPVLTAKAAATLDCLSAGRLTLGISIGGTEAEYKSIGAPINQRLGRFLENVSIMRKLWTEEDEVSFEGRYNNIEHANIRPKPVQRPVPLYFGANGEAMLRRAARTADGWCSSSGPNVETFLARARQARAWAQEAGRDPDKLGFVKQHNISIAADRPVAEKNAYAHWRNYYGPRWDISSAVIGTVEQATEQLQAFNASDVPEVTLALEPSSLDLKHLELVWEASKGLR